jgi:serine O-acetyltransferase
LQSAVPAKGPQLTRQAQRERQRNATPSHFWVTSVSNQPSLLTQLLYRDLERQFELEGRPAVTSFVRFLCRLPHPRFLPLVLCRVSRAAMLRKIPIVPQLLTYLNIVLFGLEVTPRCQIGPGIFFPHPSGTVIGARRIGRNATILQGVTLGAKKMDLAFDSRLRPEVGDNVMVGAGAKILGGICIGDNVTVGANAVVVDSVEAGDTVVGIPARPIEKGGYGCELDECASRSDEPRWIGPRIGNERNDEPNG